MKTELPEGVGESKEPDAKVRYIVIINASADELNLLHTIVKERGDSIAHVGNPIAALTCSADYVFWHVQQRYKT